MSRPLLARVREAARLHAGALALGLALAWTAAHSAARVRTAVAERLRRSWTSLLPAPRVGRLRAALVVDARDCPATLAVADLFARPELAGAVDGVTLLVRDGQDSLARYADARLTGAVQVAVVPVPSALRRTVATLGDGPRLLLVDAGGRVVWASRAGAVPTPTFLPALLEVARHHVASELATANTADVVRAMRAR